MADTGSDTTQGSAGQGEAGADEPAQQQAPSFAVNGQYMKDLSFEVPQAPSIFEKLRQQQPQISVGVDVNATRLQDTVFEVAVKLNAESRIGEETAFILELVYAGMFTLSVPREHLEPMLLIECPRFLFPFARNIVCDVTRDGGFSPLLLQPIDFAQLYRQRAEAAAAQQAQAQTPDGGGESA